MKRTSVDADVLIAAFRGAGPEGLRALELLDDPDRSFVVSDFLRLEVLPKPTFHKRKEEVAFMASILEAAATVPASPELTDHAVDLASKYDMTPIDALHISAALTAEVDEFITLERPAKPICQVQEVNVRSLYPRE